MGNKIPGIGWTWAKLLDSADGRFLTLRYLLGRSAILWTARPLASGPRGRRFGSSRPDLFKKYEQ